MIGSKKRWMLLWAGLLALILVACGGNEETETLEQPAEIQTVVVVATPTPEPQVAPAEEEAAPANAPVVAAPTAEPGQPTMTALVDLNVRTGPGTNYTAVGALRAGSTARIVGQSQDGGWWKIECPPGAGSECWSSAGSQFSAAANVGGVLIAAAPPLPSQGNGSSGDGGDGSQTATATTTTTATATATGQASPTATTAANNDPTPTSTTAANDPTPTYTPTTQADPPTPTYTPTAAATIAQFDNDSLQNPAVSVFMSITGNRNFTHSNDVSYPNGDQDDWVEFEFPNNSNTSQQVFITLNCNITGPDGAQLRATIYEDGQQTTKIVICGQGEQTLTVDNTKTQQVRIHWGITKEGIYATYDLTVVGFK